MRSFRDKIIQRPNHEYLLMSRLNSFSCEGDCDYKMLIIYIKLASLGSQSFAWILHDSISQHYDKS
jgi:hypothetical protein